MYGVEDAFKKAQAGALFDPKAMVEQERNRISKDTLDVNSTRIAATVARRC